jgi:DNA-binding transcriptional MerR regulator
MATKELLTIQDVSRMLKVPVNTLRHWRLNHIGPHSFRVGKEIRYRPENVEKWLREQERKEARV